MKRLKSLIYISALVFSATGLVSCEDTKSYSDLLNEEEHAVNWYLAQHIVALDMPVKDVTFGTGDNAKTYQVFDGICSEDIDPATGKAYGDNAPYYKMDKDGYVYMQVVNKGLDASVESNRPQKGDLVYFRFMRFNIKYYQSSGVEMWEGNAEDFENYTSSSIIYGNNVLTSTTQYGEGIQVPLAYLGYNCEVNLVVKSPEGVTSDQSQCIPYLYNMKYFKAEY